MLIKGMVPAVEPHQTVWVVDPPGAGRQVIVRIPAQIQRLALCLEYLFSPGDCVSHHFHSFLIQIAVGCDTSGSAEDLPERNKKMEIKVVQNTSMPMIR